MGSVKRIQELVCLLLLSYLPFTGALCNSTQSGHFISNEKLLLKCLLADYDSSVRPVQNSRDTVLVSVDSYMTYVVDLDEKTRVLTTELWLYQSWIDVQLQWKPEQYDGITEMYLPVSKIWLPDVGLYNRADESSRFVMDKVVKVEHTGKITLIPHAQLKSRCDIDLARFPFDTQTCELSFGPWTYDNKAVNVTLLTDEKHFREFAQESREWNVHGYVGFRHDIRHANNSYAVITFTVKMTRTSTFFKTMLILPSVVIAILTLSLFWIPVTSGERFMLASGEMISIVLLMTILEGYLPLDIGQLPAVAQYIGYNLVFITITIIISVIVFNFYHRDDKRSPVPGWMRKIFLGYLGRMLCLGSFEYASLPLIEASGRDDGERELHYRDARHDHLDSGTGSSSTSQPDNDKVALQQTLDDIRRYLSVLANKTSSSHQDTRLQSHRELVVGEWHHVAHVVDRISFWVFLFITVVCTLSLCFQ